nr:MAG TPA: hypothetical protein [Caudoviricetes sp.]
MHQPSVNKSLTINKTKSTKKTKTASKVCGFFAPCENFVLFKNKGIEYLSQTKSHLCLQELSHLLLFAHRNKQHGATEMTLTEALAKLDQMYKDQPKQPKQDYQPQPKQTKEQARAQYNFMRGMP